MTPDGNPICFHQGSQHSSESNPSFQTKTFKNFDQKFDFKLSILTQFINNRIDFIETLSKSIGKQKIPTSKLTCNFMERFKKHFMALHIFESIK